jgi:cation diffusion facilitator family transporter
MHIYNLEKWKVRHDFEISYHFGERRTRIVLLLTAVTMVIEIIAGMRFGSMALLADGWHMATHVAAFGITLFAYQYARKNKDNPDFTFSTGKVSVLGAFASAIALSVVAFMMAMESIERLFSPHTIMFNEAILVALFGGIINGISVFTLHYHGHHEDEHADHRHDQNLKAAYYHVLADTLTSILAVIALLVGKYFGWIWVDSFMGIVGAVIITKWAVGLLRNSSHILLDKGISQKTREKVVSIIEADQDNRVVDLHAWHVSPKHIALMVSIVTHYPKSPHYYKELISQSDEFSHVTVEIHQGEGPACIPVNE